LAHDGLRKAEGLQQLGQSHEHTLRSEKIFVLTMTWPRSTVLMMLAIVARSGVAGNLLPSRLDVQIQDA
jgi:hypothetical protein